MQLDSILLSLTILIFLLLDSALYSRADISFFKRGKDIRVSLPIAVLIFGTVTAAGIGLAYIFLYRSGPAELQTFYALLYAVLWFANVMFLLRVQPVIRRLFIAYIVGNAMTIIGLLVSWPLVQNLIMLGSLLWIGPVVARQFQRLSVLWVALAMAAFALIDTVNVFFARPSTLFSDERFALNGILTVGSYMLGIGDIILAYLAIALTQRFYGKSLALVLALWIPLPRLFIRLLVPTLAGQVIPYSQFIVIPALIVFLIGERQIRQK